MCWIADDGLVEIADLNGSRRRSIPADLQAGQAGRTRQATDRTARCSPAHVRAPTLPFSDCAPSSNVQRDLLVQLCAFGLTLSPENPRRKVRIRPQPANHEAIKESTSRPLRRPSKTQAVFARSVKVSAVHSTPHAKDQDHPPEGMRVVVVTASRLTAARDRCTW